MTWLWTIPALIVAGFVCYLALGLFVFGVNLAVKLVEELRERLRIT